MTEPINLSRQIREICDYLELEYEDVAYLEIYPSKLVAKVYKVDEHGKRYFDYEADNIAADILYFPIRT